MRSKELAIVAFWCPPPTEQQYSWLQEAGFDSIILDEKFGQKVGSKELRATVKLAGRYGLKAYPCIPWEPWEKSTVADLANDYSNEIGFGGYYSDEPRQRIDIFTKMPSIVKTLEKYPKAEYWVTLASSIGPYFECNTYEDTVEYYMENFGKNHRILSVDYYPLIQKDGVPIVSERWLECIEIVAQAAKTYRKDLYCFVSTMSMSSPGLNCRAVGEKDIRYQIYASLAYGAKGIEYFCYMTPGLPPFDGEFLAQDKALIWSKDYQVDDYSTYERTENWYAAKKINEELRFLEEEYMKFTWQGILTVEGKNHSTSANACIKKAKTSLTEYSRIEAVQSSEDTLIGCFEDSEGNNAFILMNFSDPSANIADVIKIKFKDVSQVVCIKNGERENMAVTDDGVYETTLQAGEGCFIIIKK